MKRCPECRRDYYDDTLSFCLEDGSPLVSGVPGESLSGEEPETAVFPTAHTTQEEKTRTFESDASTDASKTSADIRPNNRTFLVTAVIGLLVLAVLGLGIYLYFGRSDTQISSLAVMPFVNESGNADIEYLSDGMTETLISNLSQIPKLSVKARSSVFRYKGKEIEPQKVAQDLGVQAIITGRVLQRGDSLTLNMEMVDAGTGNQIWGDQYNRKLTDLVTLQSDIARDVSNKLRAKLTSDGATTVSKRSTENTEAYQLYLKGRYYWNKRTVADIKRGIEYFQQAIDKDPTYALAYAGLADGYVVIPSYTNDMANDAYPKAGAAAQKALELDSTLAEAHNTLAIVLFEYDWKFDESEKEFKRAIELNPNYANAHQWYSEYLLSMGRHDEALAEIKRAQAEDPLSLIINSILGIVHAVRGETDQAVTQLKKTIEMDPSFPRAHLFLAEVYRDQGLFENAIDEQEKHMILLGTPPEQAAKMSAEARAAFRRLGREGYYRKMLEFIEKLQASNPNLAPPLFEIAAIHATLGENDKAFEYLEKSYAQHEPDIVRLLRGAMGA